MCEQCIQQHNYKLQVYLETIQFSLEHHNQQLFLLIWHKIMQQPNNQEILKEIAKHFKTGRLMLRFINQADPNVHSFYRNIDINLHKLELEKELKTGLVPSHNLYTFFITYLNTELLGLLLKSGQNYRLDQLKQYASQINRLDVMGMLEKID